MTIYTYSLFECCKQYPYITIASLLILYFAFGFLWKLLFFCTAPYISNEKSLSPFLDAWCLAARFLAFWLLFSCIAVHCLDSYVFTTNKTAFMELRERNTKKPEQLSSCLAEIHFRTIDGKPEILWFDTYKLVLCLAEKERDERFSATFVRQYKSFDDYLQDFFSTFKK